MGQKKTCLSKIVWTFEIKLKISYVVDERKKSVYQISLNCNYGKNLYPKKYKTILSLTKKIFFLFENSRNFSTNPKTLRDAKEFENSTSKVHRVSP